MRVERNTPPPPPFEPVYLILESQEEVNFFYDLFNYTPICDFMEKEGIMKKGDRVYKHLQSIITIPPYFTRLVACLKDYAKL